MELTRRDLGKLAVVAPALAMFERPAARAAQTRSRPNSLIDGVQIGAITFSYAGMPDQSAEATLGYVLDSGISAIELMSGPLESYLGAPSRGGAGGSRGGGRRGGRSPRPPAVNPVAPASMVIWNDVPCAPQPPGGEIAAAPIGPRGAGRASGDTGRGGATRSTWWRDVSMDKVKAFRKMYADAGVSIYALKMLSPAMPDDEVEWTFNVAAALGCTHTTLELTDDVAQLKRLGRFGEKHKIYVAYHTHLQGSMTAFDAAFAASPANMSNVDVGHFVAAGGDPLAFIKKFHSRISSFHIKDRTRPEHCALQLPMGTGEVPIGQILRTVRNNRWTMPATIEMSYPVPPGSDAVKEVAKCLQFCRMELM
jgi:sugar phosphate isomerase/epimerase